MTTLAIVLYIAAVFMLGAIMGSFLNVVAVDFMKVYMANDLEHKSEAVFFFKKIFSKEFWRHMATHRSSCDTCDVVLTPKELVPVISYVWQKGTCNSCNTSFSAQHLYVEILAGVLFTGVFFTVMQAYPLFGPGFFFELIYMFVFFSFAIVMLLFDYQHQIIPNILVYPMIALALGAHALGLQSVPAVGLEESVVAAVMLALPLFLLWAVSRGRWMGMADSKLTFAMGALLGVSLGISAFVLSFWLGAIVGILLLISSRYTKTAEGEATQMNTAIAFGPFIILALWFIYISRYVLFPVL